MRRVAVATMVLLFGVSFAFAEEFMANIKKVDGNKVTFAKFDKGSKKPGEDMTLPAADNVKVVKAKFNKEEKTLEAGDPIEGGLKADVFKSGKAFGRIITDADGKNIVEIRVIVFDFKKKKDDK